MELSPAETNETYSTEEMNDLIIDAILDIKGKEIVKLDLTSLDDATANYYIICQGESNTQVGAIAQNIKKRLKNEAGIRVSHSEGERESKWVLLDYFDTVVHIFYPETRAFYDIEDLWSDAVRTEYAHLD